MNGLKIILLIFFFVAIKANKWKCKPVICPVCDYRLTDTFTDIALRSLNAGGPSDGTCDTGQKYIHLGSDFGKPINACCCLHFDQSNASPVDCNPRGVGVPDCPDNLGFAKNETVAAFYQRMGRLQKKAPENGCCRAGTFKFNVAAALTGLNHDFCVCVTENKAFAPQDDSSSSSCSGENK